MKSISRDTLEEWIKKKIPFQLLDVRSSEEYAAYNIGGILIPLDELMRRKNEIPMDFPIVCYCRKGIRSQIAIQRLEEVFPQGEFYNLSGGIGEQ